MNYFSLISILLLSFSCGNSIQKESNAYYTKQDSIRCVEILNSATPGNLNTTDIAKLFLGTPYQGGTLDRDSIEKIVVRFDSLDCTTFVETITALTHCINNGDKDFNSFVKELENIRYRNGCCNGYTSRLHYFSEWILNNCEMGITEEILPTCLITAENRTINFMSRNADKYSGITNDSVLNEIKKCETFLSSQSFTYIPKDKVVNLTPEIVQEGDIIAIVTDIEGLDISHVGFATYVNGVLHLLHASSAKNEVIIDPLPLNDYLAKRKHHIGVKVAKPLK